MENFDDIGPHRGVYYDPQGGGPYLEPPGTYGFCVSPSVAEYEKFREDKILPPWNPARHREAKNPEQCEMAFMYDLATLKGFREDPFSFGKNIAAGFVNAIIPGSDLGDSWSQGQIVGGVLGTIGSVFIPGPNIGKLLEKTGMAFNLGGILSSPIVNTIVGSVTSSLLTRPNNPVAVASPSSPPTTANSINPGYNLVIDTSKGTVSTKQAGDMPTWLLPVGIAVAALVAVFAFLRPRRK